MESHCEFVFVCTHQLSAFSVSICTFLCSRGGPRYCEWGDLEQISVVAAWNVGIVDKCWEWCRRLRLSESRVSFGHQNDGAGRVKTNEKDSCSDPDYGDCVCLPEARICSSLFLLEHEQGRTIVRKGKEPYGTYETYSDWM